MKRLSTILALLVSLPLTVAACTGNPVQPITTTTSSSSSGMAGAGGDGGAAGSGGAGGGMGGSGGAGGGQMAGPMVASVTKNGLIDCFPQHTQKDGSIKMPGEMGYDPATCETSAAVFVGGKLTIASDKSIPNGVGGDPKRSAVMTLDWDGQAEISAASLVYNTEKPFLDSIKYEDFTLVPGQTLVMGGTGFDRVKADGTWDGYNTLLEWPASAIGDVEVVSPTTNAGGITSSVGLRGAISAAMKGSAFPEGPPYFKIEGLAAIPGNKLLFGVREMGAVFDNFTYQIRILSVDYTMEGTAVKLGTTFTDIWNYGLDDAKAQTGGVGVALSSLEYDPHHDRLYMLMSFENTMPPAMDDGLGAYIFVLPMADLATGKPPVIVKKADGNPLLFAHKGEDLAVVGPKRVFVIHDDDRVLGTAIGADTERQFKREHHQAAYTIVDFE